MNNKKSKNAVIKNLVNKFEDGIRETLGLESEEMHFAFSFITSETNHRQRPHKYFKNPELNRAFENNAWVGFILTTVRNLARTEG